MKINQICRPPSLYLFLVVLGNAKYQHAGDEFHRTSGLYKLINAKNVISRMANLKILHDR